MFFSEKLFGGWMSGVQIQASSMVGGHSTSEHYPAISYPMPLLPMQPLVYKARARSLSLQIAFSFNNYSN